MVAYKFVKSLQFLDVLHDGDLFLTLEKRIEIEVQLGQFSPFLLPRIVGELFEISDEIVN